MDVEIVAAGVAANELRDNGDGGGEENDGGAEIAPRSPNARDRGHPHFCFGRLWSLIPGPCSLFFFHGSRRSVCVVCAARADGVKGSAKVVPLYQSFHWSRKYGLNGLL